MAVPYQLPNGKTVMLTIDQILDLDDIALQDLMAKNLGVEINDPFAEISYKEFEPKEYPIPDVEEIEPLDDESIDDIKKQIDEDY